MLAHITKAATQTAQEALVSALAAGRVRGVGKPDERINTHLNHVFLAGDLAIKLKRAVHLPFVDFSSLERRRAACEEEVAVNTRLGSPFYLRAAPITRDGEGVYWLDEPQGDIVDWVVVMRRFAAGSQFDVMARHGKLTIGHMVQAAHRIAAMHADAAPTRHAGHVADYRSVIQRLKQTEVEAAANIGLRPAHLSPYERLDVELSRVGPLIECRREGGKVRRTHGDLHLANICLFAGGVTPFDALEFDARMATTDVLYDLAFLLMDLRRLGLRRHANAAMNSYWDEAGEDEEALALLPFFMGLRAAVRMAVSVASGKLEEAQSYRELALQLIERPPPVLVAIGGLSGSGKSAVARELAPRLAGPAGARVLRSDVLRKRAAGTVAGLGGADLYTPQNRARVYAEMEGRAAAACRAGASTIADATFLDAAMREAILAIAPHAYGVWLEAPLPVRLARIEGRIGDASDANERVARQQDDPGELGLAWRRVDAQRSVRDIACDIAKDIP